MKSVLIVDDHPLIHYGLSGLVQGVLGKCNIVSVFTFEQAIRALKDNYISLVLLDLYVPGSQYTEVIGELRKIQSNLKILIFSGRNELTHAQHLIQRGANGFLHKGASYAESEMAVKTVLDNKTYISRKTQEQIISHVVNGQSIDPDPAQALTTREKQVLDMLLDGLWSKEIAGLLNIKHSTVGTLKARIFQKLHVENILELYKKMELYRSELN